MALIFYHCFFELLTNLNTIINVRFQKNFKSLKVFLIIYNKFHIIKKFISTNLTINNIS